MRTKIGGWLLILALVASPGAARAQDLQRWWQGPVARDAPQAAEAAPDVDIDWLLSWCARTDAPAVLLQGTPYVVRGQDIGEGFYVTDLIGFGVNVVTGDYSRGASGMSTTR